MVKRPVTRKVFFFLEVGYEEVKELGAFPYPIHIETNPRGSCPRVLQAQRRQVPSVAGYHHQIFRGRGEGLAPISARSSRWSHGPRVFAKIITNISSDTRKGFHQQPVDRPQRVP